MRNPNKKIEMSRRGFLARSACASMGVGGVVNTLAHMRLMEGALANTVTSVGDYKAAIVLFHFGATDSNNMLMPGSGHPARSNYENNRGVLALPLSSPGGTNDPHAIVADNLAADSAAAAGAENFALHPELGDLKTMFDDGELAFTANVGTLVVPTTAATYNSVPLPPQLFSHSDQQNQWQSSIPDRPFQSGWSGRIADLLNPAWNEPDGKISMSVSLSGINDNQVSLLGDVSQYSVTNNGAISLNGYGTNYANALSDASDPTSYEGNQNGRRLKAFQDIMNYTHDHLFEENYNVVVRRARQNEGFIGNAFSEANSWLHPSAVDNNGNPWGFIEGTFILQNGINPASANAINNVPSLSRQLISIAKMISGRNSLGNSRQLFFCSYGGHDTHQDQGGFSNGAGYVAGDLDDNMTTLNNALKAFNDVMKALASEPTLGGDFNYNDFILASHSDFNRTFTPNGSNPGSSGSDHAWGTNVYMMGGDVRGKNVYGYYPNLNPTGNWTTPGSSRGRWVPTSAVEQFSAPIAKWLGIADTEIGTIFPNLERFADPFTAGYDPTNFNSILSNANMDWISGV
ncbi:MAG: hypothetical protein CMO61_14535 [Verrucomicrobiales bacterium]|nr:hypothetical protein [Verrucomicrobiales bacterium]|tara:strand:+ start:1575 stop:3293 length:1719 start_codon:yes stop_codon:yes gene_type:complete